MSCQGAVRSGFSRLWVGLGCLRRVESGRGVLARFGVVCQCGGGGSPWLADTTGPAPCPRVGGRRTGFGCLGIPSPRTTVGWWAWSGTATAGLDSITCIDPHHRWGQPILASSQPGRVRTSRRLLVEAADLVVSQPVVDQDQQFAGGRHLGDVVTAPVGDAVEAVPDRDATVIAGHGFHR